MDYLEEHISSDEMHICCDDFIQCKTFPMDEMINFCPYRSTNKHKKDDEHACFNWFLLFVFIININHIKMFLNFGWNFPLTA